MEIQSESALKKIGARNFFLPKKVFFRRSLTSQRMNYLSFFTDTPQNKTQEIICCWPVMKCIFSRKKKKNDFLLFILLKFTFERVKKKKLVFFSGLSLLERARKRRDEEGNWISSWNLACHETHVQDSLHQIEKAWWKGDDSKLWI